MHRERHSSQTGFKQLSWFIILNKRPVITNAQMSRRRNAVELITGCHNHTIVFTEIHLPEGKRVDVKITMELLKTVLCSKFNTVLTFLITTSHANLHNKSPITVWWSMHVIQKIPKSSIKRKEKVVSGYMMTGIYNSFNLLNNLGRVLLNSGIVFL